MTVAQSTWRKWSRNVALFAALAACTIVSEPAEEPAPVAAPLPASTTPFREDCHQHLTAAMAALAAPRDTTPGGPSAAHLHGLSMHEYHGCLSRALAAQTTPH